MNRQYNAGLYVRLSIEDSANAAKQNKGNPLRDSSDSIENQRSILDKFAELNGWNVVRVYSDDGFSGGSFRRPGFEEMLEDAKNGVIDLILVKDLSRFGRDYIDVGHYAEDVFPSLGVRFIALMDDIDTEGSSELLPFRSILNDYHLKDLSRKIKSVIYAKAKKGEYINSVPYGYARDAANPRKLVTDEPAAAVVRRIFGMRSENTGIGRIAAALNREGILAPLAYFHRQQNKVEQYSKTFEWQTSTVRNILKNEAYIGNMVCMKRGTASYKNKTQISKPEEEWIRAENTHEPIISMEMWLAVQELTSKNKKLFAGKQRELSLFSGLLFCGECGHIMNLAPSAKTYGGKRITYNAYCCGLYRKTGYVACSKNSLSERKLLAVIRDDLLRHIDRIDGGGHEFIASVEKSIAGCISGNTENNLQQLSGRLDELDVSGMKLYERRLNGSVNLEAFKTLSADLETERTEIQAEYDRLKATTEAAEFKTAGYERWSKDIRSYLTLETINRDMLCSLIEKIEIGSRKGGSSQRDIKIYYRFVGCMD